MSDNKVVQNSVGWSLVSEVAAKFITPITNMILARLLTPADFGVLAVCNMVVSFMDIITDAGFSKFLVQKNFLDEDEKSRYACVAFWSNFILSVLLFLVILVFRNSIALALGNIEYAVVLCVASVQLIITSLSSIQMGLFRRAFGYKKLFWNRMAVVIVPLVITVPLAYITKSYWALIIGNLIGALCTSVLLTYMSSWKPYFYYSFTLFKRMFSFSFWSLCEGLGHWIIFWIDTFIIAGVYSDYYLGLYKNSSNAVMSIMGMISAAVSPVLLSVLSRLQGRADDFRSVFFDIFKIMSYLTIPMGLGLFCFSDVVTYILLGSQWGEAANVIGAWGLMMIGSVIFYTFTAELYKSTGIPRILFLFQVAYLVVLIPVCKWAVNLGFWEFVYLRCACIVAQIVISMLFIKQFFSISPIRLVRQLVYPLLASTSIVVVANVYAWIKDAYNLSTFYWEFAFLVLAGISYVAVIFIFFRNDLLAARKRIQQVRIE